MLCGTVRVKKKPKGRHHPLPRAFGMRFVYWKCPLVLARLCSCFFACRCWPFDFCRCLHSPLDSQCVALLSLGSGRGYVRPIWGSVSAYLRYHILNKERGSRACTSPDSARSIATLDPQHTHCIKRGASARRQASTARAAHVGLVRRRLKYLSSSAKKRRQQAICSGEPLSSNPHAYTHRKRTRERSLSPSARHAARAPTGLGPGRRLPDTPEAATKPPAQAPKDVC